MKRTEEFCGQECCGHVLHLHSDDGYCMGCFQQYKGTPDEGCAVHFFQTTPPVCRCCGDGERKAEQRSRENVPLCDECRADPALAFAECKHGYGEASPVEPYPGLKRGGSAAEGEQT